MRVPHASIAFGRADDYSAGVSSVGKAQHSREMHGGEGDAASARYTLDRQLAQGGMAALYLGQRLSRGGFAKPVVLKRLRPELSQNSDARALFLREACLGATLEHPAVVRVLDLTEIEGVLYLVMEYVRGGDLRLVLRRARRRNQRFLPAAALYIGRELCAALDYAHGLCLPDGRALGLIHRDISPTNILLSTDGEVKLTDFGIAQADAGLGQEPRARGHVGYMSPEQARGDALDVRSDLFSLATVIYEVFTGNRLFVGMVGQHPTEVYGTPVVPPSQIYPDVPADVDAVLLEALALPVAERPPSARVLYQRLLGIAQRHCLWMDRSEFSAHLHAVCGPDPAEWATLEERTATALIASVPAETIAEHESPGADILGGGLPGGEFPDDLMTHAARMVAAPPPADELSEPAITIPWPTLLEGPAGGTESDYTVPLPSTAVTLTKAPRVNVVVEGAPCHGPGHDQSQKTVELEPDASEATLPSRKLSEHSLDMLTTAQNRSTLPPARPFLQRERLTSFVCGVLAGLLMAVLIWFLVGFSCAAFQLPS